MKKVLLASLLLVSVVSANVFAGDKGGRNGRGPGKPTFTNGCLVVSDDAKGPMADAAKNADADGDGCITETELKTYMKDHKPEGKGPRGGKRKSSSEE